MSKANGIERIAFFKNYCETEIRNCSEKRILGWFNRRKDFDHLCTIKEKKSWKTQRGEIKVDYPLMEDVEFKSFYNKNVISKPFQIIKESEEFKAPTNKEIKSIQVPNNYSNKMFSSIANQVFKLDENINPSTLEETPNLF